MEKKINVAELLRNCPSGMELDCTSYDNVLFDKISDDKKAIYPIFCYIIDKEGNRSSISFTENGCESKRYGAKCVIFPKGKTTWDRFVPPCKFKDGDVLFVDCTNDVDDEKYQYIFILNKIYDDEVYSYCYYSMRGVFKPEIVYLTDVEYPIRFATEEEKEKLFQAIKDNGYNWNEEKKVLEKLIESKEDTNDKVVMAGIYFDRENYADEVELHLNNYEIEIRGGKTYAVFKKPKFKVGDRIRRKNSNEEYTIIEVNDYTYQYSNQYCSGSFGRLLQDNYELVPNKFDINTLVPFESRVLVRNANGDLWKPAIYGFLHPFLHPKGCYVMGGVYWRQYIPYEGNEHLRGTTDDCEEFYKMW